MDNVDEMAETPFDLLTIEEREALEKTAELWNQLTRIVGDGPARESDLRELMGHIHGIQRAIGAQVYARLCPSEFRQLGMAIEK